MSGADTAPDAVAFLRGIAGELAEIHRSSDYSLWHGETKYRGDQYLSCAKPFRVWSISKPSQRSREPYEQGKEISPEESLGNMKLSAVLTTSKTHTLTAIGSDGTVPVRSGTKAASNLASRSAHRLHQMKPPERKLERSSNCN